MNMKRNNDTILFTIIAVVGGVVLGIASILLSGFVIQYIWNNIIAVGFDLQSIPLWLAIGVKVFIGFTTINNRTDKSDSSLVDALVTGFGNPLFNLFIAWVVTLFI